MKKYTKLIASICILFLLISSIFLVENSSQNTTTLKQRETFINQIKGGAKILSETKIEKYIISAFEASNNEFGLAVFVPDKNSYKFQSCVFSNSEKYVNLPLNIDDKYYLIIWSNNPNINRVSVRFNDEKGIELDFVELMLGKYEIVVCFTPFKEYTFDVTFYDIFDKVIMDT